MPYEEAEIPANGWDRGASGPDEPGGRPEKAGMEGGRSEQDCTPVTPPLQPSTPTLAAQRVACTPFSLALLYGASGAGVNNRGHNLPARPRRPTPTPWAHLYRPRVEELSGPQIIDRQSPNAMQFTGETYKQPVTGRRRPSPVEPPGAGRAVSAGSTSAEKPPITQVPSQ